MTRTNDNSRSGAESDGIISIRVMGNTKHPHRARCAAWLRTLTVRQFDCLVDLLEEGEDGITMDWVEDHGGERCWAKWLDVWWRIHSEEGDR